VKIPAFGKLQPVALTSIIAFCELPPLPPHPPRLYPEQPREEEDQHRLEDDEEVDVQLRVGHAEDVREVEYAVAAPVEEASGMIEEGREQIDTACIVLRLKV
jgi:hypothetical protein